MKPSPLIFLYGPSGSGKSSSGELFARALELPFWDLDEAIQARTRLSIADIFRQFGERGFRSLEKEALQVLLQAERGVISLGGGALLDAQNRCLAESRGTVVCLTAPYADLLERLRSAHTERPLLNGDLEEHLQVLLRDRKEHYASFPVQLNTGSYSIEENAWRLQVLLGRFRIQNMGTGYDVIVHSGGLDGLGELIAARGLRPPLALVSDENVASLHAERVMHSLSSQGLAVHLIVIPPGEGQKDLATLNHLWEAFLAAGLERSSTVLALGGGVVTDLAGFAAATFLRGVPWVALPTSLLGMVDASLGGKTGIDLPGGKNLVGAFYPPRLVLADPQVLTTLPEAELRNGMAEVVKHGVIADPQLFELCAQGWGAVVRNWEALVSQAMAVKVRLVGEDPYEKGARAALNLGHTLGHAIEAASAYTIRHGEAVSIGMLAISRLGERLGLTDAGFSRRLQEVLTGLGLPCEVPPGLDAREIIRHVGVDKKRQAGIPRFVVPVCPGEVKIGLELAQWKEMILGTESI